MNGIAGIEPDKLTENLQPLFQEILKLPKAQVPSSYIIVGHEYLVFYKFTRKKDGKTRIILGR